MTNHPNEIPGSDTPLDSWKEIAAYLQRDVSTAIRWEKSEELPVHRHQHSSRASVYAFTSELDAWKAVRKPKAEEAHSSPPVWKRPVPLLAASLALFAALAVVGMWRTLDPIVRAGRPGEMRGIELRQVWAGKGADDRGAPSPDGRHLLFVDWDTGDLAVRDLGTGENRRLTHKPDGWDTDGYAYLAIFSPDGTQVAYNWNRSGEADKEFYSDLRILPFPDSGDPSEPRTLLTMRDQVNLADWSSDGRYILVRVSREDKTNQIAMVSTSDGSLKVLKTVTWENPNPLFSPDGKFIAYDLPTEQDRQQRDIYLLATDGSRETVLVEHPADEFLLGWSGNGDRIFFSSDRTGATSVFSVAVAGGKRAGKPRLVKRGVGAMKPLGMTDDGTLFYRLPGGMQDVHIAEVDPASGELRSRPERLQSRHEGENSNPAWSPDGKQLAYLSLRGGAVRSQFSEAAVLVIRSLESGEEQELSRETTGLWMYLEYSRLLWSPDGRSIVTLATDKKGRGGLYRIDVSSGESRLVRPKGEGDVVAHPIGWADERTLIFRRNYKSEKDREFYRGLTARDMETGQERELYRHERIIRAAVSPDGTQVAFNRAQELMVVPVAGGEARSLYRVEGKEARPDCIAWTPDSSHILFCKQFSDQPRDQVWMIPAEGGTPVKTELRGEKIRHISFHPDGGEVVYIAGKRKPEIWAMENFLSQQRAEN